MARVVPQSHKKKKVSFKEGFKTRSRAAIAFLIYTLCSSDKTVVSGMFASCC